MLYDIPVGLFPPTPPSSHSTRIRNYTTVFPQLLLEHYIKKIMYRFNFKIFATPFSLILTYQLC